MKLAERWHTARHEGDLLILQMLRISYFMSSDVLVYFTCYAQLPLLAIYVIAFIIVVYIFIKEKMMAFLNILLIVSNILEIVPLLILTPITSVFLLFAKKDVPVPSPWCNILILTNNSIYHILNTIAINFKILLAINRICGVYFPLKFHIWFSRKRCAIYSFVALALGGCIGCNTKYRRLHDRGAGPSGWYMGRWIFRALQSGVSWILVTWIVQMQTQSML